MSDTPRTDEAEYRQTDSEPAEPLGMVDVSFARQLERELNAANEKVKRLEGAGSSLRTAAAVFRLKEIEDDDGRSVLMEDLPKYTGILYDDYPTAGEHVALSEAMNNWTKAKETNP